MGIDIENDSFDKLHQEISLVKGGPGPQSGGYPPGQSGGHPEPGGECFAPYENLYIITHNEIRRPTVEAC